MSYNILLIYGFYLLTCILPVSVTIHVLALMSKHINIINSPNLILVIFWFLQGWEKFTDAVIRWINSNLSGVVFLLWGAYAQKKGSFIDKVQYSEL